MPTSLGALPYAPNNSRLSELLMRQGEQRAQAALRSGDIWGNALQGVGSAIAGGIQDYQQNKLRESQLAIQQQKVDQEAKKQADEFALRQKAQEQADKKAIQDADIAKQTLAQKKMELETAHADYLGHIGAAVSDHLSDPDGGVGAAMVALDHAKDIIGPEEAQKYAEMLKADPSQLATITKGLIDASPAQRKLMQERADKQAELADKKTDNDRQAAMLTEMTRHNKAAEAQAARSAEGGDAIALTPEGRALAAQQYAATGTLPPMGMGKAAAEARAQIINEAARANPNLNMGAVIAGFGADKKALGQLQAQTDAVSAFENTAKDNSKLLDEAMNGLPDAGASFLNKPLRATAKALGSEGMTKFDTIRQSVANEYARILANPNLSGTMSDSARHEAEVLLSPDATPGQIRSALKTLAQEAGNRHKNYSAQLEQIKGRIRGAAAGTHAAAPAAPVGVEDLREKYNY